MVEIFTTNIDNLTKVRHVKSAFQGNENIQRISFDIFDCDHVLKVEYQKIEAQDIIKIVKACGFLCKVMND